MDSKGHHAKVAVSRGELGTVTVQCTPQVHKITKVCFALWSSKLESEEGFQNRCRTETDLGGVVAKVHVKRRTIKEVWSSLSQQGSKEEAIVMVEAGDMLDDQEKLGAEWQRRKGVRWKSREEACQVTVKQSEWRRIAEALCAA